MGAIFGPATLADGDAVVVQTNDGIRMTLIPGAGATVTYSRVDDGNAEDHDAETVAVVARTSVDVDWPYYMVSTAGGGCRVAVI